MDPSPPCRVSCNAPSDRANPNPYPKPNPNPDQAGGELPTRSAYGWSGVAFGGEEFLVSATTGTDEERAAHGGAAFCTRCDYLLGVYAVAASDFSVSFSVVS